MNSPFRKLTFAAISISLFLCSLKGKCQDINGRAIHVGKPVPHFKLRSLHYYSRDQITSEELIGHWYVLDFWHKYCSSCVASFAKTNNLQKVFKEQLQFFLIGREDKDAQIQSLYEKFRTKQQLELAVTYDSSLHNQLGISGCPFLVIVDPNGKVRGVTGEIDSNEISDLLNGKVETLPDHRVQLQYNNSLPLLTFGNGGSDTSYLFRSLLTRWKHGMPDLGSADIYQNKPNFEGFRLTLHRMYYIAYMGSFEIRNTDSLDGLKLYPSLVNEADDKSMFDFDLDSEKGLYCYSLCVPPAKANREYMMEVMQRDLKNYFGYNVAFETRKMPYWSLTASENAKKKLMTKGGHWQDRAPSHAGFAFINLPTSSVVSRLTAYFPPYFPLPYPPFIDETGIKGNIDIEVDALLTDFDDFRRGLEANGLYLVKKEKEMKVLVIRDPKPETE